MQLYPHQINALKQTENFNRVAYYLDMGLGKTFVGSEKLKQLNTPYNLLVCQKSKIDDWYEHFKTHYDYEPIIFDKQKSIPKNSVLIINYDLVWRRPEIKGLKDFTLMLDESQYIKNESASRSKFILKINPENVILLSGTPTGGKYEELWSQLKLLGWNISRELFWRQFIDFEYREYDENYVPIIKGYKNVDRLKQKLHEYGAVFMKSDEVFDLPEQIDTVIKINNTKEYMKFKNDRVVTVDNVTLVGDTTLTKLLYLRELASIYNPNKAEALRELLESTNDRVIVFYNFKAEFELMKNMCKELDRPISKINGEGTDLSNYDNQNNSITLVQYQAGSSGVNLQKANKVVYYSLPLSSELYEQSRKRIHRIGQDRTCWYYQLLVTNSVEYNIMKTLKQRKDFTDELFKRMEG